MNVTFVVPEVGRECAVDDTDPDRVDPVDLPEVEGCCVEVDFSVDSVVCVDPLDNVEGSFVVVV